MFCKKCGFEYPDNEGIAFCKRCGAPIRPIEETPTISETPANTFTASKLSSDDNNVKKGSKKVIAIVALILVIVAIGAIWFFYKPTKDAEGINEATNITGTEEIEKPEENNREKTEEETPVEKPDNNSIEEESVISSEEADEMFIKYLRGEVKDAEGEDFWAINDPE